MHHPTHDRGMGEGVVWFQSRSGLQFEAGVWSGFAKATQCIT